MGINQLLARSPSQTLTLLEGPEAKEFNELIKEWSEHEFEVLLHARDVEDVHRAQGALKYLSQIIDLPETIRSYLHDVSTGKRKKIEEVVSGLVR